MTPCCETCAITALYTTYADGVNQRDATIWISCWDENARWQYRDRTINGVDAIRAIWQNAMENYAKVDFFSQIGHIDIAGDTATVRAYTMEFIETTAGESRTQIGEYADMLVRRDGGWCFAQRAFHVRTAR